MHCLARNRLSVLTLIAIDSAPAALAQTTAPSAQVDQDYCTHHRAAKAEDGPFAPPPSRPHLASVKTLKEAAALDAEKGE